MVSGLKDKSAGAVCPDERPLNKRSKTFWPRLFASTFLWIFVFLFVVDIGLDLWRPLKNAAIGGYIPVDRDPARVKLGFLLNPLCHPDVVAIGSSIAMSTLTPVDHWYLGALRPGTAYERLSHTKPLYLQNVVREACGKDLSVFDLAVPGCMPSDAEVILQKAFEARPQVKMLIMLWAPRDFGDKLAAANPRDSVVIRYLLKRSYKPFSLETLSSWSRLESWLTGAWYFPIVKADYQTLIRVLFCQAVNRGDDSYCRFVGIRPGKDFIKLSQPRAYSDQPRDMEYKRANAAEYFTRYNPFDGKRLAAQFDCFDRILARCRSHNVEVVVIDLPQPELHLKQMSADMRMQYLTRMKADCNRYGAHLLELQNDPDFVIDDYVDTSHLVATGGKKVLDRLGVFLRHEKLMQ